MTTPLKGSIPPEERQPLFITSDKKTKWYKSDKEVRIIDSKGTEVWLKTAQQQSSENTFQIQYGVEKRDGLIKPKIRYVKPSADIVPKDILERGNPGEISNALALQSLHKRMKELNFPLMDEVNPEEFIRKVQRTNNPEIFIRELDKAVSNLEKNKSVVQARNMINNLISFPLKINEEYNKFPSLPEIPSIKTYINLLNELDIQVGGQLTAKDAETLALKIAIGTVYDLYRNSLSNNLRMAMKSFVDIVFQQRENDNDPPLELAKRICSKQDRYLFYFAHPNVSQAWPKLSSFLKDMEVANIPLDQLGNKTVPELQKVAENIKSFKEHQDSYNLFGITFSEFSKYLPENRVENDNTTTAFNIIFSKELNKFTPPNLSHEDFKKLIHEQIKSTSLIYVLKKIKFASAFVGSTIGPPGGKSIAIADFCALYGTNPEKIESVTTNFKLLAKGIQKVCEDKEITQQDLIDYFMLHIDGFERFQRITGVEDFEVLADKITKFIGLSEFYINSSYELGLREKKDYLSFIKEMELANMTSGKLRVMVKEGTLFPFLEQLSHDIEFYKKNEDGFKKAEINLPRYLRLLEVMPDFRKEMTDWQGTTDDLIATLKKANEEWVTSVYSPYQSEEITALFEKSTAAHAVTGKTVTPLTKEHLAEIMTFANALLAKGTIRKVTTVSKKISGLARSFTIVPQQGFSIEKSRIIIHLKQKDQLAFRGSFKKITSAIVIEGDKVSVDADIVLRPKDQIEYQAALDEIALYNNQPKGKHGKYYPGPIRIIRSEGPPYLIKYHMEKFAIPDLRALFAAPHDPNKGNNFKQRLKLAIDLLKGIHFNMHLRNMAHNDIKLDNGSARPDPDDNKELIAFPFDFGLASKLGEISSSGTPIFFSPSRARSFKSTTSSDLWSYGIALYELLCTPSGTDKDHATVPPFLKEISETAKRIYEETYTKILAGNQAYAAFADQEAKNASNVYILKSLSRLQQEDITAALSKMQVYDEGLPDEDKAKIEKGLRLILESLLQVNPGKAANGIEVIANLETLYKSLS